MIKHLLCLLAGNLLSFQVAIGQMSNNRAWGNFQRWGDQGNGYYRNPVLPGDYSDVDCIRVENDFYAISSTFQFSPGIVIIHSKDLVNWSIIGHVVNDITQIGPAMKWDKMDRYAKGIWAGSIRYHAQQFWIYFGTPDEGYFMTTSKNITGPWEPLHQVLRAKGWDDCCPFWDEDGKGYFVGTNFSDHYKTYLFDMTADSRDILKKSAKIINEGEGREANKLYKIRDYYYHLFSEYKPGKGRYLVMQRSKNIIGPYREKKQLNHGDRPFMEPNQGGLVQAKNGEWYFLTHHGTGDWSGRAVSLLPVKWIDGWPIIGKPRADGIGSMVWSGKKPVVGLLHATPQTSDEFMGPAIQPQWEWNYQPRADKWSLIQRPGWLRMYSFVPLKNDDLLKAGNTLTQRSMRTSSNEVVIKLDLSGMADQQKAGLCHFAAPHYSSLGITRKGSKYFLEFSIEGRIESGPWIANDIIWLRSTWGLDGNCRYSYSLDGVKYIHFGRPYHLAWGSYRGDRVGIYSYNNRQQSGHVDVDFFHYTYDGQSNTRGN